LRRTQSGVRDGDLRTLQLALVADLSQARFRLIEGGLRSLDRHAKIARVDAHDHLLCLDRHVVVEQDLDRIAGDPGAEIGDLAADIGVIRGLDVARDVIPAPAVICGDCKRRHEAQRDRNALQAGNHASPPATIAFAPLGGALGAEDCGSSAFLWNGGSIRTKAEDTASTTEMMTKASAKAST